MSGAVWLIAGVAAIVAIAIVVWSASRRSGEQLHAVRQEMQNSLASQGQAVTAQINNLMQSMTTQLGQVRQELHSGVASSGKLASDAQIAVAQQLQASSEAMRKISQQLGEVQQTGRDMSQATQTLQTILGGAKTRGILGEVALEGLLKDALPQSAYDTQYRFASRARWWTPSFATAIECCRWIRSFRSKPIGGWWIRETRRLGGNFPRRCASMPTPSRKNTFCRTSTLSITR